ncbi:MAG: exo-alpha-sialidase, partial [Acidobacteria bacterium]|nr:exo-alpha-sialidase [Acidobacteriota bacterium]
YRFSSDYGRTWSAPVERPTGERRHGGMLRRHLRGGWVDPATGRFLESWVEGTLPNDDPLEGLRQWNIFYTVSEGDPRKHHGVQQVIHKGAEFDARHPLPGVYTGKNCVMLGDQASQPLAARDGRILLPVEISPLTPDGALYNPGGGYTYHDSAVLHGRWNRTRIEWEMSDLVRGDPQRTTRGMVEPTVAELAGGRTLLVMRGSNDRKPELPGYRWVSFSSDGGWKWTKPEPWTYDNGRPFFSPSACSQLLPHSNGKVYWLGNITAENPKGNRPRYPFCVGEVDRDTGRLIRDSLRVVDDLRSGEDPLLTLSNFYAREDRQTREICLHMTRLFALPNGWEGDAMLYRISA